MAKGVYVGTGNVAHKVKKIYLGIDNVAHKVKKGYIGDANGLARLFFINVAKIIKYTGSITGLETYTLNLAAAANQNYALFGGGKKSNRGGYSTTVNAYNSSLVRSTATALSTGRENLAAASIGEYVLFAGGITYYMRGYASNAAFSNVDAYSASLTRSRPTSLANARGFLSGATVGNYALFAGGWTYPSKTSSDGTYNYYTAYDTVDAYDSSLTKTTASSLSSAKFDMAAATIGNYALFAGGRYTQYGDNTGVSPTVYNTVNAYSTSLTRSTATSLSTKRYRLSAAVAGDYALFAGGRKSLDSSDIANTVDAYNKSLTRSIPTALSSAREWLAAKSLAGSAIFGGGRTFSSSYAASDVVDIYDSSLTRTIGASLSQARYELAACTIDNYALFAGGINSSIGLTTVDAYTITYD